MKALIIGGSSGLGLALAKRLVTDGYEVIVTGRRDPKVKKISFMEFDLSGDDLPKRIEAFCAKVPKLDLVVYAAGYYQEGRVTDLSVTQIEDMINVGGRGLLYGLRAILNAQGSLPELITITSTSQWIPRQLEPIYNFVKAGAGHFTNALAEDGRIQKVMVAGPAGMNTAFWKHQPDRDMSDMLDPDWVAEQIMKSRAKKYKYKNIRILRAPARVEEVEER